MATASPIGSTSNDFSRHLDTVRIAAYFGLLFLFIRPAISYSSADGLNLLQVLRVVGVVVYLILDLVVRRVSRTQIAKQARRANRPSELSTGISGLLLLVEILGVAMFAVWAVGFVAWKGAFSPNQLLGLGIFAVLAAAHNMIHIAVCPGTSLAQYFRGALVGDAFQITQVSGIWMGRLRFMEERFQDRIARELEGLRGSKTAFPRLGRVLIPWVLLPMFRAAFHYALQFCALHVVYLNLLLGGLLIFHAGGLTPDDLLGRSANWNPCIILGIGSYAAYCMASATELMRRGEEEEKAGTFERCMQGLGNMCLIGVIWAALRVIGLQNAWQLLLVLHALIIAEIIYASSLPEPEAMPRSAT